MIFVVMQGGHFNFCVSRKTFRAVWVLFPAAGWEPQLSEAPISCCFHASKADTVADAPQHAGIALLSLEPLFSHLYNEEVRYIRKHFLVFSNSAEAILHCAPEGRKNDIY